MNNEQRQLIHDGIRDGLIKYRPGYLAHTFEVNSSLFSAGITSSMIDEYLNEVRKSYQFAGRERGKFRTSSGEFKMGYIKDFGFGVWHEESYSVTRSMGSAKHTVHGETLSGMSDENGHRAWYDVRKIPPEARATLAGIDGQIAGLQRARREFIDEHFAEWPIAQREDANRIIPRSMTKAEATKAAKDADKKEKLTAKELDSERSIVRNFNKIFDGK